VVLLSGVATRVELRRLEKEVTIVHVTSRPDACRDARNHALAQLKKPDISV
jgi:hypothetical protein